MTSTMCRCGRRAAVLYLFISFAATGLQAQEDVEEVIVTGSYLKRSTLDSRSPISIIDRARIEEIGATTVQDIVYDMTYNSGSITATTVFFGGDDSTGTGSVNLRNLGLGSTLVLLNSRRPVKSETDQGGNAYVDIEGLIPTIAIERVEVLNDGASALYGSDAVAGVVNFITRRNFSRRTIRSTTRPTTRTMCRFRGSWGSRATAAAWFSRWPISIATSSPSATASIASVRAASRPSASRERT